ncbi:MAG: four-carbon acid sugar kinase family protein [Actinomycetales bacterium]
MSQGPQPDARASIRGYRAETGRRIVVLDDDPTGSQSVYGVSVVTALEAREYEAALAAAGSVCFILTNTRSLDADDAVALNREAGRALLGLERRLGAPIDVVSRSDSTLRGHVIAEVRALDDVRREVTGRGYDGVLLAPSYFEAGRFTSGDVHWAMVGGKPVPAGETEFAGDATFGYASSDLKDFIAEKSGGTIPAAQVLSIGLEDIRDGGAARVAQILRTAADLQFVVVNATEYSDLETVVLGLAEVQREGKLFLHRTGPSFVRALAGLESRETLRAADIWPEGRTGGHGLAVVGSHVGQTARQIAVVQARGGVTEIELSVAELVDDTSRDGHVAATTAKVTDALGGSDVLLYTSRSLLTGADAAASLDIARTVSGAVIDVVRGALAAGPAWVIAKGGITSHDVAVRGLGIRRATVLGQLFPGMVSVLRPVEAADGVAGMPYVVFAGNVGDDNALADTITLFRGDTGDTGDAGSTGKGVSP